MRRLLLVFLLLVPSLAFAQGSKSRVVESVDPKCMQRSVEDRDTLLAAAANTYNDALRKILKERKEEVSDGWGLSDPTQRKDTIRKAWTDYQKNLSKAQQKRNAGIRSTWKEFDRRRASCGQRGQNTEEPGNLQSDLQW